MDYPDSKEQPLWIQIARWIALIPGAFFAKGFVVIGGFFLLVQFSSRNDNGIIWPTVITAASSCAFLYCGMWIAPKYKKPVGYVLAGFLIALDFIFICRSLIKAINKQRFFDSLGSSDLRVENFWEEGWWCGLVGTLIATGVMILLRVLSRV